MTPTQKLQQIKNWLFGFEQNHQFAKYKGADGLDYEIDGEISMGKELYKVMEDGKTEMAADGTYTIDGKVLEVVKGIISDVISSNRVIGPDTINVENKKEEMSEKSKFVTDALLDDTQVSISGDKIVAGADLKIVKDGEELLPPAGEHELKSGVVVVVDDAGKILEVKPVEEKPEVEVEVEAAKEVKPEDVVKDSGVKNVEDMMKQMMEAVLDIKEKMAKMEDKQVKMGEEFAAFKKEPAAEPLKRNTTSNYQFGSGENPRVKMIEALKGHIK